MLTDKESAHKERKKYIQGKHALVARPGGTKRVTLPLADRALSSSRGLRVVTPPNSIVNLMSSLLVWSSKLRVKSSETRQHVNFV